MADDDLGFDLEDLFGAELAEMLTNAFAAGILKFDPNSPQARAKALMGSDMRNRYLRRAGRVEYRCKRGCFLGAVFTFEGQEYFYWRQWTEVNEVYVYLDDMGKCHEPETDKLRGKIEEAIRSDKEYDILSDHVEIMPSTIKEMAELQDWRSQNVQHCVEWPVSGVYTSVDNTLNANCGHSELVITPEQIENDIRRLRSSKKRVVFVEK